eukprot:sb/3477866/
MGFELSYVTKVPYLCTGDLHNKYYSLSDGLIAVTVSPEEVVNNQADTVADNPPTDTANPCLYHDLEVLSLHMGFWKKKDGPSKREIEDMQDAKFSLAENLPPTPK